MFKNNVGFLSNTVENLFTANVTVHNYNTRNKHKLRAARGIHQYVYSTFCFVGIQVWNYITDHINTQVTLPKFKKNIKNSYTILFIYFSFITAINLHTFRIFFSIQYNLINIKIIQFPEISLIY